MERRASRAAFLTFDVEGPPRVEDSVNTETVVALHRLLQLLEKHHLRGFFFITGSAAAKLQQFPNVLELLKKHEIGYHSSIHSRKPRIFEDSDVEDYEKAMEKSKERETSTIDLDTGSILGDGGILLLRKIFPDADIASFRAPFLCWSPPHLEAMRELGLKYDFSTSLATTPVLHRGITFYPYPVAIDNIRSRILDLDHALGGGASAYASLKVDPLMFRVLRGRMIVLLLHPASLHFAPTVSSRMYYKKACYRPRVFKRKNSVQTAISFFNVGSLLAELSFLKKTGAVDVTPPLKVSKNRLNPKKIDVEEIYQSCRHRIAELFGYNPRYLLSHLRTFFS